MNIDQIDKAVEAGEMILDPRGGVNPPLEETNPSPRESTLSPEVPNPPHEETTPSPREPTLSPEGPNLQHGETNPSPREPTLSPEGPSPPHEETNPSPREPTLSPVEPNQPLAQFALRRLLVCSYFGCNLEVAQGMRYCSQDHSQMANSDKGMAYVVVDDFFNVQERNARCIISLMKKAEGIMTGIVTIQDSTIFRKMPWEWGDWIDRNYLNLETSRSWLFYHPITRPKMGNFVYDGSSVSWTRKSNYTILYDGDYVSASTCYLRHNGKKGDWLDFECSGWSLSEYIWKGKSLYCLTMSSGEESKLFKTGKDVPKRKRKTEKEEHTDERRGQFDNLKRGKSDDQFSESVHGSTSHASRKRSRGVHNNELENGDGDLSDIRATIDGQIDKPTEKALSRDAKEGEKSFDDREKEQKRLQGHLSKEKEAKYGSKSAKKKPMGQSVITDDVMAWEKETGEQRKLQGLLSTEKKAKCGSKSAGKKPLG